MTLEDAGSPLHAVTGESEFILIQCLAHCEFPSLNKESTDNIF